MAGSPELLEYYLVEATEYVDALDQVITADRRGADANALLATARALRGSSTMAQVDGIAGIAQALEDIALRAREGDFPWTDDVQQGLRATVTDLRHLVRAVRVWTAREEDRARHRTSELRALLPSAAPRQALPSPESTTPMFVALQCAAIAAELDAFVDGPGNRRALDDGIARLRTLRGVAGITEYPPLADVADAVERAGRQLMPDAPLSPGETELFRAASRLFRVVAGRIRAGDAHAPPEVEAREFAAALSALEAPARNTPPVVRIDQLFYADQGPHLVERAPAPPIQAHDRLHRDLLARADHLQRLISEARVALDPVTSTRLRNDLRATSREVESLTASYGAHQTSAFFSEAKEAADPLAPIELEALSAASRALAQPFLSIDELERRIAAVHRPPSVTPPEVSAVLAPSAPVSPARPLSTPAAPLREVPMPAAAPGAARRPAATPTGAVLKQLLASGLNSFRSLETEPLSAPADLDALDVVPIESLLYRGSAALTRAIELRDTWRARGAAEDDTLREILDLLDLARAE
jgi:chemotaxis protein histidine kinase CheA